jgi:hypothetical protein
LGRTNLQKKDKTEVKSTSVFDIKNAVDLLDQARQSVINYSEYRDTSSEKIYLVSLVDSIEKLRKDVTEPVIRKLAVVSQK